MSVIVSLVILSICIERRLSQEAPKLNHLAFPSDLAIGSRASVLCDAYQGDQPLDFRWLKDGRPLTLGTVQEITPSISKLNLEPLKVQHVGNYTCRVTNAYGSAEQTASLFVKAPPRWIKEPMDVKVAFGGTASLDCQAVGSPQIHISWKRRTQALGDLVNVVLSSRIQIMPNNSLILTNVQKSEDGLYMCEASNGIGEDLKKTVQVHVFDYPHVQRVSEHTVVEKGTPAEMSCLANGDPPFELQWTKDGKSLRDWPDNRVTFTEHFESGSTKFSVAINPTEIHDEGLYICSVKNEFGSDEKEVRLLLVEKPQVPQNIEIVDVWSRSARITWSAPSSGNSPILGYTLEFWSNSGIHRNESVSSSTTSWIVRNLSPFTVYKLQVWAANSIGTSDPSKQIQFTTAKEEPSSPPTDLSIESTGSTFIRLSWKSPPPENWNGGITGFYIGYKQSSSQLPFTYNTVDSTEDQIHYVLRGLKKATSYTVSVRAFNDIGSGPHSQELSFRTLNHDPVPRPTLMMKSIGSTHIQLQWYIPEETKTSLIGYTLHYKSRTSSKWQEISIPDPMQITFTLTNLDSGVLYQVFLTAESSLGASEPSEIATVQTMAEQIFAPATLPPSSQANFDEFTQTLYIVVPIAVATVIIVLVIVVACVYVYSRRPVAGPQLYGDVIPDKGFTYMATIPRHRDPQLPVMGGNTMKYGSPYSTVPLTRSEHEDDEPIYESVMEEIRCKIKQRAFEEDRKIGNGTIV